MKVAMPGASRLSQALRALPGVRQMGGAAVKPIKNGATAESFSLLALNTRILLPQDGKRAVVVMSAFPKEGRTFVAANLAVALAEERPVILVEQIGEEMPLRDRLAARRNGSSGLVPASLRSSTMSTDYTDVYLHATPRGNAAGELSTMTTEAAGAGFFTVVDSPPALTSSSAFLLAREVGYAIYVVTRKVQDVDVHRQIRDQLDRLGVQILGLVVNEG